MPRLLYALGVLIGMIGLLTIGFSIPARVREIGLGDSLIIAGTTAVIGGLLFATVSTLFFVPAFFSVLQGSRRHPARSGNEG